jgi:hypothetical protein
MVGDKVVLMQNNTPYQWWWHYDQQIGLGATVVMPLSCTGNTFAPAGLNVALTRYVRYLEFSIKGSTAVTLEIQITNQTAALVTWIAFAYPGGTVWNTVYDLPAPYAGTGGRLALCASYTRIRVIGGAANSANFQFNARAWKE